MSLFSRGQGAGQGLPVTERWQVPAGIGELRVVMLGAGKMARLHLATLQAMAGVRVVGLCSRTRSTADELASAFAIPQVDDDLERLLAASRPDAAVVAVSHRVTAEVTATLLGHRIPCLIEKPVALTAAETGRLAELAASRHCFTMVGLNRRYYSVINEALLTVLQHGPVTGVLVEIHEAVRSLRSRLQLEDWLFRRWMVANSIHVIDLLRMIGGEVRKIAGIATATATPTATGQNADPDACQLSAALELEHGAIGTVVAHWGSARGHGLKIFGHGLVAELLPLETGMIRFDNGTRVALQADSCDLRFKPGLYRQNAAFLQGVCDGGTAGPPASDLADNLRTMQLVERLAAAAGGGAA